MTFPEAIVPVFWVSLFITAVYLAVLIPSQGLRLTLYGRNYNTGWLHKRTYFKHVFLTLCITAVGFAIFYGGSMVVQANYEPGGTEWSDVAVMTVYGVIVMCGFFMITALQFILRLLSDTVRLIRQMKSNTPNQFMKALHKGEMKQAAKLYESLEDLGNAPNMTAPERERLMKYLLMTDKYTLAKSLAGSDIRSDKKLKGAGLW